MCQFVTVKELPALGYLCNKVVRTDLYMKLHTELGRLWLYTSPFCDHTKKPGLGLLNINLINIA